MAVRLKQHNLKLSSAITGALIIGGGMLLLRTFPHIKAAFKSGSSELKSNPEEDNTPVPMEANNKETDHVAGELAPTNEAQDLTDNSIKSRLLEKEINPPPNATHDELVAILESTQ